MINKKLIYIFIYILVILNISCTENRKNTFVKDNNRIDSFDFLIKIEKSIGDQYIDSIRFLPLPVNVGTVNEKNKNNKTEVLIIANRSTWKKKMKVNILGAMSFSMDSLLVVKVIGIPANSNLQVIKSQSFSELLTYDFGTLQVLKDYFSNYNSYQSPHFIQWHDKEYAIKLLNDSSKAIQ